MNALDGIDRAALDNLGRRRHGRLLSPTLRSGYLKVQLHQDGRGKVRYVHSLVLEAFVGPRPAGQEACHGVGGPTDNRVENLRWGTHSENIYDQVAHGTHPNASRDRCIRDHRLEGPNLEQRKPGVRGCRACHQETSTARYHGEPFNEARADERYRTIMSEAK